MIAIGVALMVFGWVASLVKPPARLTLDGRDLFSTLPFGVGMLLTLIGVLVVLWRYLP